MNKTAQGEKSTKWDSHKHWRLYNSNLEEITTHLLRLFLQVLQNWKKKLEVLENKMSYVV